MPLPLKPGYNFNFERIIRPPHFEMNSAEAYTDFYGISYMVSGDRLIYSPTFTTIAQAGDMVFIPKNVYRRTTYISNEPYERILIKFSDCMIEDLLKTIGMANFEELCQEHVIRFDKSTQTEIYGILREIEKEWNSYNEYSELLLKGLLNKLIITSLRKRIISGTNVINWEKKHDCLANAIKYIKIHLRNNPSLEETAAHINISSSYLSKLFVNRLHTPYSAFVLNEKIALARKLLLESKLSMTEIAFESGFSSSAYFSDCFKRVTGTAPLQYRKQNR